MSMTQQPNSASRPILKIKEVSHALPFRASTLPASMSPGLEGAQMEPKPINYGFFTKIFVIAAYKILTNQFVRRLRKPQPTVAYVSSHIGIKATAKTTLAEAHAMQFVAEHTSIPVPKVYSAFTHSGTTYILMERIDGEPLTTAWVQRLPESKARILAQLKSFVNELREIPPPDSNGVSNIIGGPVFDERLPDKPFWGPFASVADFHRELRNQVELKHLEGPNKAKFPEDMADLIRFHHETPDKPVFTHGDLSSFNILVRGDKVVGIVDWETAGWMPAYWEYTTAWNASPSNLFWQDEVDKYITPLPHARDMENLRRQYFGGF
ncbi:hypothetical protein jhhlp_004786 [Lomentospora prolificans]|uniref:Aminoglycoside phosphotransferase domain-containing protein n=1 Tax=Lomentospora prolificans TaxID=41688 RepID=A0A2N3N8G0_9PEZI|nr:hypothetical protein jhhlp_004786 [Lomentospora prolificans]